MKNIEREKSHLKIYLNISFNIVLETKFRISLNQISNKIKKHHLQQTYKPITKKPKNQKTQQIISHIRT